MNFSRAFVVLVTFFLLGLASCATDQQAKPEPVQAQAAVVEPGLIHSVYFWLNDSLSVEEQEAFRAGVRSLGEIPSARRIFIGPPASTPSRGVVDNSFDQALVVWFDDVAGHDAYQIHPIHLAFVEANEAKFAEVKVYDNVLE